MIGMNGASRLAHGLLNKPLAMRQEAAEALFASLSGQPLALAPDDPRNAEYARAAAETGVGYDLVDGVAVIRVEGMLVQNLGLLRPLWGMVTGYDGLRLNLAAALENPKARALLFLFNSPGGEVAGLHDLADSIAQARDVKPIWGILDEEACSAAYALASACSVVTVPRTGIAGSIGTVIMHTEQSRMLDRMGITVTPIRSSPRKMEGNSAEPLTTKAHERLQAAVDAMNDVFVQAVARNRGMDEAAVRATDAGWFVGAEAVNAGLVDAVMPVDDAFAALLSAI